MLSTINRAMLPAGAAEMNLKMREMAFEILVDTLGYKLFGIREECGDRGFFGKEFNDGIVFPRILAIFRVAAGVREGTTVEDETAAVATWIVRNALLIAEAPHTDGEGGRKDRGCRGAVGNGAPHAL